MAQLSFSTIRTGFKTAEEAKAARDAAYKHLRSLGHTARRSVLRGQLRKWAGLGIPDGRICDVYMIDTDADWGTAKKIEDDFGRLKLDLEKADQKYFAQLMS